MVYLAVKVERNKIRPITSADDMVGFPAAGRTAWTADCPDYANLFDGSTSTRTNFTSQNDNVVTIDMKSTHMVTGIDLNSAGISSVSFEYSTDGQTFLTAGTPASNEYGDVGFQPLHRLLRLPRSPLSAPNHQFLKQLEQIRQRIQHL